MVENQLGAPMYARTAHDEFNNTHELPPGEAIAIPLPPLHFPELMHATSRESTARQVRHFVALRIVEAQVRFYPPNSTC